MEQELPLKTIQTEDQQHALTGVVIFLGIIAFFAVGLGGVMLGKYLSALKTLPVTPVVMPTDVPATPTPDATASWKTFTNAQYGISFRYPEEADFYESPSGTTSPNTFQVVYLGERQRESGRTATELGDGYMFYVVVRATLSDSTVDQIAQRTYAGTRENCYETSTFTPITSTSIAGKEAKTYAVTDCLGDYTEYFVSDGTYVFELTQLYVGEPVDQEYYKQMTDRILSTFRFTD